MRKTISVYSHDSNPACDPPLYFISRHEADLRIEIACVRYVSKRAVQLMPPPGWTPEEADRRGLFDKVWQIKPSDNYLVWQMRPHPEPDL